MINYPKCSLFLNSVTYIYFFFVAGVKSLTVMYIQTICLQRSPPLKYILLNFMKKTGSVFFCAKFVCIRYILYVVGCCSLIIIA